MKFKPILPLVAALLFISNCGADKAAKEKQPASNPSADKKSGPANNLAALGGDIVGEWEMVGFVVDTNDNLQIDAAERSALKTPSVKDYMKLNRDGSGEFTVAKMPGRFEITDTSGKKMLTWYDRGNGRHRVGTILKVTQAELHIKEPGGHGMFVWKRL